MTYWKLSSPSAKVLIEIQQWAFSRITRFYPSRWSRHTKGILNNACFKVISKHGPSEPLTHQKINLWFFYLISHPFDSIWFSKYKHSWNAESIEIGRIWNYIYIWKRVSLRKCVCIYVYSSYFKIPWIRASFMLTKWKCIYCNESGERGRAISAQVFIIWLKS